jgi:hypothetical protein
MSNPSVQPEAEPSETTQRRASCSLLVGCSEDVEEFISRKPHRHFNVWKGRDVWHQKLSVQVRMEDDGNVSLSTREGHVSTIRNATMSLEDFHTLIRSITANAQSDTSTDETK